MSKYVLTYFPARGRAEQIRLLLEDVKAEYEDVRLSFEEFGAKKAAGEFPFGSVPTLKDGEFQLAQSGAILHYLGEKYNLLGKTAEERALAVMIVNGAEDLRIKFFNAIFSKEKDEAVEKFLKEVVPAWLPHFSKLLKKNNEGKGYMVGDSITTADYAVFDVLETLHCMEGKCLENYPELAAYFERIASRENLQEYMKSDRRPPAPSK